MVHKKQEEKNLPGVMKEYSAVFSVSLSDGFANISFDDKGEMVVQILDDEGVSREDAEHSIRDIQKIAHFVDEMKPLRLEEYKH